MHHRGREVAQLPALAQRERDDVHAPVRLQGSPLTADTQTRDEDELLILLSGVVCFADLRNHPSGGRGGGASFALNFHRHLSLARDAIARIVELTRSATTMASSRAASLISLRRSLADILVAQDSLLRAPRVSYQLFRAILSIAARAVTDSGLLATSAVLDAGPELDHASPPHLREIEARVRHPRASRLTARALRSIARARLGLDLVDSIMLDPPDADHPVDGRAYVALAALRSEGRALSILLGRRAGDLLAESFERDLARVPASDLAAREADLRADGARLATIRMALHGLGSSLRLEMRRAFEHDLPPIDAPSAHAERRAQITRATSSLRAGLQIATLYLARSLGAKLDESAVFGAHSDLRATSERLRRDVWMFAHIARAFASKARRADAIADRWDAGASADFVRDFLAYYRSLGYPLLCASGYPRVAAFVAAMKDLKHIDLPDDVRVEAAVHECETFYAFLTRLFEQISRRDELVGVPFDRRDAARALRIYIVG